MLFRTKLLKVIFATKTLAVGIRMYTLHYSALEANTGILTFSEFSSEEPYRHPYLIDVPCKCVVFLDLKFISVNEFLQMSGRAGRRGIEKQGHVLFAGSQARLPHDSFGRTPSEKPEKFHMCRLH